MEENVIEEMIERNIPFAIIQYFTSLKTDHDTQNKVYEVMCVSMDDIPKLIDGKPIKENGKTVTVKENVIKYKRIEGKLLRYFINNVHRFKLNINNEYGKVYEYNDFKRYVIKNVKQEYR